VKKSHLAWLTMVLILAFLAIPLTGCSCGDDDDDDNDTDDDDDNDVADDDDNDTTDDDDDNDTGGDDDDDDTPGDDDDDDTPGEFYSENFEGYTPPTLTEPWVTDAVNGDVSVVALKDGSGQALQIDDADADGDYAYALRLFDDDTEINAAPFTFQWDFYADSGFLTFEWLQSFETPESILYFPPDGDSVQFLVPDKTFFDCEIVLAPGAWYSIEMLVNPTQRHFSLSVDGVATACVDVPYIEPSGDARGFMFIGTDEEDLGGVTRVDNLRMFRDVGI
jgi:hypothetical protein